MPFVEGMDVRDSRTHNYPPRWNAAPSQDLLVIRRNHRTGADVARPFALGSHSLLVQGSEGRPQADQRQVRDRPPSTDLPRCLSPRRCIVPVDGFFEWKAIKGQKAKQPYAIAMKDGSPFGLGGLWENWKDPASGEWVRTFAIITTDANELVADIHDRMPLILAPGDYARWLSDEPDPRDLMRPFPAEPMRMWPISTRVNKPENDDPSSSNRSSWPIPPRKKNSALRVRVTRGAALALLNPLLCFQGRVSGGVIIAKFPGHAVTLRRSPTVLFLSNVRLTRILSGRLPRASCSA